MVEHRKLMCLKCGQQLDPAVVDVFADYAIFAAVCGCGSLASGLKLRIPEAAARARQHLDEVLRRMVDEFGGDVQTYESGARQ